MVGLIASEFAIGEHPPVNGKSAVVNAGTLCTDPETRLLVKEGKREAGKKRVSTFFIVQKIIKCVESSLIHN